jgi:hypothetical protein
MTLLASSKNRRFRVFSMEASGIKAFAIHRLRHSIALGRPRIQNTVGSIAGVGIGESICICVANHSRTDGSDQQRQNRAIKKRSSSHIYPFLDETL